jgi:tetratricopeptide (TPR) repeat protein
MGDQTALSDELDPRDPEAFQSLEETCMVENDWRTLEALYERYASEIPDADIGYERLAERLQTLIDSIDDDREAARIGVELGDLYVRELDDLQAAKQAYKESFTTDKTRTTGLERARDVYRMEQKWEKVLEICQLHVRVASGEDERVALLREQAVVYGERLDDFESAESLIEEALERRPDSNRLEQILEIYESGSTLASTVEQLVELADHAYDSGDPTMAIEQYVRAGRLEAVREGGEPERALEWLDRVLEHDPDHDRALDLQDELEARLASSDVGAPAGSETEGGEVSLPEALELGGTEAVDGGRVVDDAEDSPEDDGAVAADLSDETSEDDPDVSAEEDERSPTERLYDRVPDFEGDLDEARAALEDDPSDLSAFAALRAHWLETGEIEALIDQLEETVKYFRKEDEEPTLMGELAHLYWKEIGDLEQAEYCFKQLKLLDDDHPGIFEFYRDYRRERGEWRRLFSLLNDRLDTVDDPDRRRDLVARRAEVAETRMESPEQAINVWKRYLREHEGDSEARAELERLYEENEKWNGLVGFLEDEVERLEGEGTRERRVELLERIADLYEEKLGRDVKALKRLERVVELQPDRDAAFERLCDKLESNRNWSDLVDLLDERMERLEDDGELERAADRAEEIAEILDDHQLRHEARASDYWQHALEWDPARDDVRERLEDLYRSRRDYESLFELERQRLERLEGDDHLERLRDLRDLAESKLRSPDRLVPILREILEHEPDDLEILERLDELHRQREDWETLMANLERRAELLEGYERLEVLREAARLHDRHVDDLDRSIGLWERVLEEDESNRQAIDRLTNLYLDADRYDALETLYRSRDQYRQLFDLLDSAAQTSRDDSERADLYRRMAHLAEEDLEDLDSVLIGLESLLEVTDDVEGVARELADWYRRADELESEIEMMELVLEEVEGDDTRLEVLERLATLEAERGDSEEAFRRQMEAIELDPSRSDAIQRAEGFAGNAGTRVEFSDMLEAIAADLEDERQTALWWTIARIEAEELERPERALNFYERIHEREPDDLEVLSALARLYDTLDQPADLVETLRHRVELRRERDVDVGEWIETLGRIAEVEHEELDRLEAARETYGELLELEPDHLPAIRGMKALHREAGEWLDVIDRLERELELLPTGDDEAKRDVQFELAEVYRCHRDDYDEALHYYRQILEAHPDHEPTVEAVRSVLDVPEHARDAALLLEPVFRRRENHEARAETLEAHLSAARDDYESQDVLDDLVPLYRDALDNRARAFELAREQFELDPDRVEVRERLEALADGLDRWETVESLYDTSAPNRETNGASSTRYDLLLRLTDLRRDALDDLEGAADALEIYYDWAPDDAEVAQRLESLYRELERPADLVGILEDRTGQVETDDARIELHEEAARLYDETLDDSEGAIARHRSILDLDPERESSVEALERLFRDTERWDDLHELLLSHLDRLRDPDTRRDVLLKIARLRSIHLDDYTGAEEILSDLLAEQPNDEAAVQAMEELDVELIKTPGDRYDLRERIARDLEPIYRQQDVHEQLADVLEVQLRGADDPTRRRDLLDELAELYADPLDRPEDAFEKYRAAVTLDPDDTERREAFERIGRRLEAVEAVVETLEEASAAADRATAAEIDRRLGECYEHDLDDPDAAIDAYRSALDWDDADREALRALERLYDKTGDLERLADTLRQQITYGDPERRPALLERVAELERDELDRPERAIDAYEEWLELEPESRPAIDALETLYPSREAWTELAELLERKAELVDDTGGEIDTRLELARVYEEELYRPEEAIEAYEMVLELEPMEIPALDALERLHRDAERWDDVADILRRRLVTGEASDPERRTEIEMKLADILRTKRREIEDAIELYQVVLSRNPDHEPAVEALEAIADDPTHTEEVADELVDYYERQEAWSNLIDLYERRAEQVAEPDARASFLYRIGRVYRDGLDDPTSAIEVLASAWELTPSDESIESNLLELIEAEEAWARLADVYRDVLPAIDEPSRRADLHMRLADLERDALDDPLEAESEYREVLAIDPTREPAYESIESILVEQERWLDLVDLLEDKLEVVREHDSDRAIELLLEIADHQRHHVEDDFSAAETYERILAIEPSREEALDALSTLYRRQERWEDLAEHVERRLEMATTEEGFVRFSFELAELHREHLYQPERALEHYGDVLDVRPTHDASVASLETMFDRPAGDPTAIAELLESAYQSLERWADLVEILTEQADLADDRERELERLDEAIELADERVDDPERAFELAGRRFEHTPTERSARETLQRLAARTGRWEEAVDTYDTVLQHHLAPDADARALLSTEQADLLEARLGDLEQARRVYGEALLDDPHFEPALDGMERVLWRLDAPDSLETFYRDRADDAESDDGRRDWLLELARFRETVRGDVPGALDLYRDVHDLAPDHDEAREAIERLYRREARWRDLVEFYRRQVEYAEDDARIVEWRRRAGRVLERRLDDVEGALHQYRQALETMPGDDATLEALDRLRERLRDRDDEYRSSRLTILETLIEHLDASNDADHTRELLEEKRHLLDDFQTRAELAVREADLVETHADHRLERADILPKIARAHALQPDNDDYRDRLEAMAEDQNAWSRVPGALLESMEVVESPDRRSELLVEIGDLHVKRLDDPASAATAYQRAAELTAAPRALEALESILPRLERWTELTDVLETRLERATDADERRRLLERLGHIHDDVLDRPRDAARYYERLLDLDADELDYYDTLESLYEQTGTYDQLAEVLSARLEHTEDEETRIRILRRLGEVQKQQLDDPEAAIETYRALHAQVEEDRSVVDALVQLYERTERWRDLLQVLGLRRDFAEGLDEVNGLDFRRGRLQADRLDAPGAALESFRTVLERDRDHVEARRAVESLAERGDDVGRDASDFLQSLYRDEEEWTALEELLEGQLDVVDAPERRGELYMELGQLYEEAFDNRQMAFAMLGRGVRELPDLAYLRHELDRLSQRLDNANELIAIYEDTLDSDLDDPDIRRDLHMTVSRTAAERLDDLERARNHVHDVLDREAYDAEALEWLDQIDQKQQNWTELVDVLERRIEIADTGEANDLRFRLGYLYENMLDQMVPALEQYREVIEDEPGHKGSIEGLERMVEEPELRLEIADLLEPAYRRDDAYGKLVQLFELKLDVVDAAPERATLHKQIADFQIDELGELEVGYAHLGNALRADPHAGDVQRRLEDLASTHDMHDRLVALYEDLLEELTDPIRVVELAERAAEWAHQSLEQPDRAAKLYRIILDIESEHEAALDGLETIAREEDRNEELESVLQRKADLLFDPDEQRDVLLELGEVRTEMEAHERAAEAYRQALLLDESDTEVMERLVGLYEITEQYDDLVDTLERLASYVEAPEEAIRLNLQIARYARHFLDRPDRAIEAAQRILQLEADHRDALELLEDLYETQQRWTELRDLRHRLFEVVQEAGETEEAARLACELGELAEQKHDDVDEAIDWYRTALEHRPGDTDVVGRLRKLFRETSRWSDLTDLIEGQVEAVDDDHQRASLLLELAEAQLEQLDDPDRAEEVLEEALQLAPDHPRALDVRATLHRREEDWEGLIDILDRRLEQTEDAETEASVHVRRARLLEDELDAPDEAIASYRRALDATPTHDDALDALRRLYEARSDHESLYHLLEHEATHLDETDARVERYLEMAELADETLERPELAVEALESAREHRPHRIDVVEPLVESCMAIGDYERALPAVDELIEALEDDGRDDDRVAFRHLRGQLYEAIGALGTARDAYESVYRLDDTHIPNLMSLGELCIEQEDWEEAKRHFQQIRLHQMKLETDQQKVEMYYNLGRIRRALGDERRARERFERALSIDGDHEPSQQALDEM